VLTLENLPPPNTLRWSKRRKCELLAAIDAGLLSRSEACSMYRLSVAELAQAAGAGAAAAVLDRTVAELHIIDLPGPPEHATEGHAHGR
jgi:hypothetical protein